MVSKQETNRTQMCKTNENRIENRNQCNDAADRKTAATSITKITHTHTQKKKD